MDSLIYYSNSHLEPIHELNSEITILPSNQLLLSNFKDESFTIQEDSCILEPQYDSNDLFLPGINTYNQEYNFQSFPKRQKFIQENYYPEVVTNSNFCNEFIPNPPILQDLSSFSMPEFPISPQVYNRGENGVGNKVSHVKKCNEKNLSAQSIAARLRRKKITEKTQELGKLIPGGQKMNTAEMFQAAYKYIKFLQAQAGIFEVMGSYQEKGESFQTPELMHNLVGSPLIQEKLYSSEKCIVPKMLVDTLANDHEIQHSNPRVMKEANKLIMPGSQHDEY